MSKNLFGAELFFNPSQKPRKPAPKGSSARRVWRAPESPLDKVEPSDAIFETEEWRDHVFDFDDPEPETPPSQSAPP